MECRFAGNPEGWNPRAEAHIYMVDSMEIYMKCMQNLDITCFENSLDQDPEFSTLLVLSCQPRVTVMSCFVYKVIRHLESIDHLCRIGLIQK